MHTSSIFRIYIFALASAFASPMSPHINLPIRTLAGIIVPDTPLIDAALSYARANLDDNAYNHVVRSLLLGQANHNALSSNATASLAPAFDAEAFDAEAFAVSALLHDLGWSKKPTLISADKRFEVDGAIAARDFLEREAGGEECGWDGHRVQLVWDAIALHASGDIARFKEPEVALTNLGISIELIRPEAARGAFGEGVAVTKEQFDEVVREFPRPDFRRYFRDNISGFGRTKPETTFNNWQVQYGERFVEGYSTEGRLGIDLLEALIIED